MATTSSGVDRPDGGDVVAQVGGVEQLLAGRLRRRLAVVRLGEQALQQVGVNASATSPLAVTVERLGAAGGLGHRGVDEGVGRADVEGDRRRVRGDDRDVGDAAEVEGAGRLVRSGEQQFVERAGEGRTVATGGDVTRPQVGDDRDAGGLGDPRRLADLHVPRARPSASTQWKIVWPWDTTRSTAPPPNSSTAYVAASANAWPTSVSSRHTSSAVVDAGGRTAPRPARSSAEYSCDVAPSGRSSIVSPTSWRSATATSMPSIDVPLIIPTTLIRSPASCRLPLVHWLAPAGRHRTMPSDSGADDAVGSSGSPRRRRRR